MTFITEAFQALGKGIYYILIFLFAIGGITLMLVIGLFLLWLIGHILTFMLDPMFGPWSST